MKHTSLNEYPDILTVAELKAYLRIGQRQAYALCQQDDFPSVKIGGSIRIPKKALTQWMESHVENKQYDNPFSMAS